MTPDERYFELQRQIEAARELKSVARANNDKEAILDADDRIGRLCAAQNEITRWFLISTATGWIDKKSQIAKELKAENERLKELIQEVADWDKDYSSTLLRIKAKELLKSYLENK